MTKTTRTPAAVAKIAETSRMVGDILKQVRLLDALGVDTALYQSRLSVVETAIDDKRFQEAHRLAEELTCLVRFTLEDLGEGAYDIIKPDRGELNRLSENEKHIRKIALDESQAAATSFLRSSAFQELVESAIRSKFQSLVNESVRTEVAKLKEEIMKEIEDKVGQTLTTDNFRSSVESATEGKIQGISKNLDRMKDELEGKTKGEVSGMLMNLFKDIDTYIKEDEDNADVSS